MLDDFINKAVNVYVDNARSHYVISGELKSFDSKCLEIKGTYKHALISPIVNVGIETKKPLLLNVPRRNISLIVLEKDLQ